MALAVPVVSTLFRLPFGRRTGAQTPSRVFTIQQLTRPLRLPSAEGCARRRRPSSAGPLNSFHFIAGEHPPPNKAYLGRRPSGLPAVRAFERPPSRSLELVRDAWVPAVATRTSAVLAPSNHLTRVLVDRLYRHDRPRHRMIDTIRSPPAWEGPCAQTSPGPLAGLPREPADPRDSSVIQAWRRGSPVGVGR